MMAWRLGILAGALLVGLVPSVRADIVGGEYFIGEDPGEGNGVAVDISERPTSDSAVVEFDLDTADLPVGEHEVFVRFRNSAGAWGGPQGRTFTVQFPGTDVEGDFSIFDGEYFINEDPGEGNGVAVAISEHPTSDTAVLEFDLDTTDLSEGEHEVFVRFRNSAGTWGRPQGRNFTVQAAGTEVEADYVIVGGEYFVDEDPGVGKGTPLSPEDGAFGGATEVGVGRIETAALTVGAHTVFVRLRDQKGVWSEARSAGFTVDDPRLPEMGVDEAGHDFGPPARGHRGRVDLHGEQRRVGTRYP